MLSVCKSDQRFLKAKNKKLKVWSGIRFEFEDSAIIPKSDKTHSYRRWSYNMRTFKTLAGNSKQKFELIVFMFRLDSNLVSKTYCLLGEMAY